MAILTAHHAVNTRDLPEIAEIGDGSQFGGTSNANVSKIKVSDFEL